MSSNPNVVAYAYGCAGCFANHRRNRIIMGDRCYGAVTGNHAINPDKDIPMPPDMYKRRNCRIFAYGHILRSFDDNWKMQRHILATMMQRGFQLPDSGMVEQFG